MQPYIDDVRKDITRFLRVITDTSRYCYDTRFDFLAFHHSSDGRHWYRSVKNTTDELLTGLHHDETGEQTASFFTRDIDEFCQSMANNTIIEGETQQLFALDTAMDFPWRSLSECRRVVVLLTAEPVETGCFVAEQLEKLPQLKDKATRERIWLFLIAPESEALYALSVIHRCEYMPYYNGQDIFHNIDLLTMLKTLHFGIPRILI